MLLSYRVCKVLKNKNLKTKKIKKPEFCNLAKTKF